MRRLTPRSCCARRPRRPPGDRAAQAPSGGAEAPHRARHRRSHPGGGALLGEALPRRRGPARRPHRPRRAPRPRHAAWTRDAHDRRARRHVRRPLEAGRIGRFRMRALVGDEAPAAAASPELTLTVYRPAIATWYGPGFYGRKTACGHRDDRGAPRRRPQQPAVRHPGRRALRAADDRRPGRRPRPVRGGRTRTSPPRPPSARLHRHGSHRRGPPRPAAQPSK